MAEWVPIIDPLEHVPEAGIVVNCQPDEVARIAETYCGRIVSETQVHIGAESDNAREWSQRFLLVEGTHDWSDDMTPVGRCTLGFTDEEKAKAAEVVGHGSNVRRDESGLWMVDFLEDPRSVVEGWCTFGSLFTNYPHGVN